MKTIYLDSAATTMVDSKVVRVMEPYLTEKYGNASSLHHKGQEAKMALDESREIIAKSIGARFDEIIFTSGGTEANNLALKGSAFIAGKGHVIVTKIEHDCVLNTAKFLEAHGFDVDYINVDEKGYVDLKELENKIRKETIIVSVIHGNNETGTVQDLEAIGKICKKNNILFHTDACQSYTKIPLNVNKMNLDLVTLNAHKIHGPKGVGALYVRKGTKLAYLAHGGGQEFGIRSGTENISGIVGFSMAVKLAKSKHVKYMNKLKNKLIDGVLKIPNVKLNGGGLPNIANFSFKYIEGEAIGAYLDVKGICTSTGSACSSTKVEASHVLKAMGLTDEEAHGSLRVSLSRFNTEEEIDYFLEVLPSIVEKLRKISGGKK